MERSTKHSQQCAFCIYLGISSQIDANIECDNITRSFVANLRTANDHLSIFETILHRWPMRLRKPYVQIGKCGINLEI